MVLKAVKMRIYPNSEQRDRLMQTFGCARFVWNQMLNMQIERRKNNPDAKFVNAFGMNNLLKRLKEEYPWLKQAESTSLQSANRNLADAFQRFFKGRIVKSSATLSRRKLQMDSSSLRPYVVGDLNP